MNDINPGSPIPLYIQIKEAIKEYITEKKLPENTPLFSERKIAEIYSVSRLTARKAVEELIREGVVFQQPSKGTFVSPKKLTQPWLVVTSFSEAISQEGRKPGSKLLEVAQVTASQAICEQMEIECNTTLLKSFRIRYVDNEPFCVAKSYIPYALVPEIEKFMDSAPLYDLLRDRYDLHLAKTHASLEAILADYRVASLLEIKIGAPMFLMKGTVRDSQKHVVEYFETFYRGDRLQFITESR